MAEAVLAAPAQNYIAGEWSPSASGDTVADLNPARMSEVLAQATSSTAREATAAVDAAALSLREWRNVPAPQRGDVVRRTADVMESRRDALARLITREEGKTLPESLTEIDRAIANMRFAAGQGARLNGETIPSSQRDTFIYTVREPIGVVAAITPWNFPVAIPVWKMAPALVAGCTVVFKPASLTPLCAAEVVRCFVDAGLPRGVLNMVLGRGSVIVDTIVDDPRVAGITFTGSSEVGRRLYTQAAKRLCKVQLEMGGKNAVIVAADADLEKAAESAANGAFMSTGQRCTATSRAIVVASVLEEFTALLSARAQAMKVGDGLLAGVAVGPLVDDAARQKVHETIAAARRQGVEVLLDGSACALTEGYFVAPTIFANVDPRMSVARDEIFGPVLSLIPAASTADALLKANAVDYGLSSSLYTRDLATAMRYVNENEAGMLHVNLPTVGGEPQAPFGGIKESGFGERECGTAAFDFFTEEKVVYVGYA